MKTQEEALAVLKGFFTDVFRDCVREAVRTELRGCLGEVCLKMGAALTGPAPAPVLHLDVGSLPAARVKQAMKEVRRQLKSIQPAQAPKVKTQAKAKPSRPSYTGPVLSISEAHEATGLSTQQLRYAAKAGHIAFHVQDGMYFLHDDAHWKAYLGRYPRQPVPASPPPVQARPPLIRRAADRVPPVESPPPWPAPAGDPDHIFGVGHPQGGAGQP